MKTASTNRRVSGLEGVKIGCCGFAGSQGRYFDQFGLVEVQQTFYEPPRRSTAERWRAQAPREFEFTLKAWQIITHDANSPTYRRLRTHLTGDDELAVGSFRDTPQVWQAWRRTREIALAVGARVIVFQCPASFDFTEQNTARLRQFFKRIGECSGKPDDLSRPMEQGFLLVWEPRGQWEDGAVAELCQELNLVHGVDPFARRSVTQDWFYFRLHGIGGYQHRYSEEELKQLAAMTNGFRGGYCLFNNIFMREDAARFAFILNAGKA
ncbi:MAG: DUF72 domain-containing protein [Candidatus Omnitrophica bacterium]|nr:DUF72 domain-containing protein [Candidatus Omnitrophota bacterium]